MMELLTSILVALDNYLGNVDQNDSRKIYRAKHVLSRIEGTPSTQRTRKLYSARLLYFGFHFQNLSKEESPTGMDPTEPSKNELPPPSPLLFPEPRADNDA
jgi:hypothetical protein